MGTIVYDGKDLSDFLNKTKFDKDEFHDYAKQIKFFYLFNLSSDETAGDLGATPHFVDLLDYMDKKVKNESYFSYSAPKMVIQGGHDTTINLIQYFMFTAFNIPVQYVKFGAHVYFELHKDDRDKNINNRGERKTKERVGRCCRCHRIFPRKLLSINRYFYKENRI